MRAHAFHTCQNVFSGSKRQCSSCNSCKMQQATRLDRLVLRYMFRLVCCCSNGMPSCVWPSATYWEHFMHHVLSVVPHATRPRFTHDSYKVSLPVPVSASTVHFAIAQPESFNPVSAMLHAMLVLQFLLHSSCLYTTPPLACNIGTAQSCCKKCTVLKAHCTFPYFLPFTAFGTA